MSEIPLPLRLLGAPGSPYTRKMRGLLRYRRLAYELIIQGSLASRSLPPARVPLLPTFYLPDASGQLQAVTDSTPLARRFEAAFPERSALPRDPVLAFLDALVEDYADEWLTKAMFHFRWAHAADVAKAAAVLPWWGATDAPAEDVARLSKLFAERQISRLYVVGSNETTAPVIESSYRRFLELLDAQLAQRPFLLGARPAIGDFAVYGQLTQLALFDPTPARITLEESARIYAWVELMEDLSGLEVDEAGWLDRDAAAEALRPLLGELGRTYVPVMLANEAALARSAEQVECEVDGRTWRQRPFPYQAKCLGWLREARAALAPSERSAADAALAGTGCEALFVPNP